MDSSNYFSPLKATFSYLKLKYLGAKKDEVWTKTLYFTTEPNISNSSTEIKKVHDELEKYFTGNVEETDDGLVNAQIFRNNLVRFFPAWFGAWHEFTVVESKKWFWSFEKNPKGIYVQRSKKDKIYSLKEYSKNIKYCFGEERTGSTTPERRGEKDALEGKTVQDIFVWIYNENHLNIKYDLTNKVGGTNCHSFASLLFEAFVLNPNKKP